MRFTNPAAALNWKNFSSTLLCNGSVSNEKKKKTGSREDAKTRRRTGEEDRV
jgi:hypothetical protein